MLRYALCVVPLLLLGGGCAFESQQKKLERMTASRFVHQRRLEDERRPTPPTHGVDADGQGMRLEDHAGKVVLLSFWHSQCPPCRALFAHEKKLVQKFSPSLFALVGVNADPTPESLQATQQKAGLTWKSFHDGPNGPLCAAWGIEAFPTLVLLDQQGKVRWRQTGVADPALIDRKVQALIEEQQLAR